MRLVAIRAILHHRRVLPQERTTALHMAAQAVFGCGRLKQLLGIRTAVRIMTTRARDLALAIRHVGRTLELCTAHLVALQAQLRLLLFRTVDVGQRRVEPRVA